MVTARLDRAVTTLSRPLFPQGSKNEQPYSWAENGTVVPNPHIQSVNSLYKYQLDRKKTRCKQQTWTFLFVPVNKAVGHLRPHRLQLFHLTIIFIYVMLAGIFSNAIVL